MPALGFEDYSEMSPAMGMSPNAVKDRFEKDDINRFTINQLKVVIKHFRKKLSCRWSQSTGYPMFLILTGRKAQLIDVVKQAIRHKESPKPAAPPNAHVNHGVSNGVNGMANGYQNFQNGYHHPAARYLSYIPNIDVDVVTNHESFMQNRSPFHVLKQVMAKGSIITAKKTDLRFSLDEPIVNLLRMPKNIQMGVFLRLFCARTMQHVGFNQVQVSVLVNHAYLTIDTRATNNGIKKKGLEIIKPLDITKHCHNESVTIEIYCQSPFQGVVTAELVQIRTVDDIVAEVTYTEEEYIRDQTSENKQYPKRCEYCGTSDNLLRCSRCKSTWYCGETHQEKHWAIHAGVCKPAQSSKPQPPFKPRSRKKISAPNKDADDDDECAVVDARCSLRCPLSVGRIKMAAKGEKCPHPQCFDLSTYVGFSNQTGIWQCPICEKPLPFEELEVDELMNKILSEVSEEIYQVRVLPDGTYKIVSPEEEKQEESRAPRPVKRRKISPPPPENDSQNDSSHSNGTDIQPPQQPSNFNMHSMFSMDSRAQNSPSPPNWPGFRDPSCEMPNGSGVEYNNGDMEANFFGTGESLGGTLQNAIVLE